MMHSNLTRWIEDADAKEVLLQGAMIYQFQESTERQYMHVGPTIKAVASWWHHNVAESLLFKRHGPESTPPITAL